MTDILQYIKDLEPNAYTFGILSGHLHVAITRLESDISTFSDAKEKLRRRVEAGRAHESHLSHMEGWVEGLKAALSVIRDVNVP